MYIIIQEFKIIVKISQNKVSRKIASSLKSNALNSKPHDARIWKDELEMLVSAALACVQEI